MTPIIVLDSGPLSLLTQGRGVAGADRCRAWLAGHAGAGSRVVVPEIANYEVRRELIRTRKVASVARLDRFLKMPPVEYIEITSAAMHTAAEPWGEGAAGRSAYRPSARARR